MPYALILLATLLVDPIDLPRVMDDRLQLELVCENPDVVHPIGLTIDAKGRLLVIESHTHFPPKDYAGPPHDRILLIDPKEKPAKPKVFFEGSKQTMSIARAPDDSIYVATRSEIFRLRDTDGDDKADERTRIAHLETAGNYPHNGLAGLAFPKHHGSRADELRFGFGENLGADYKLIGSDGTSLAGGGEGGNVYACRFDGSKLRRVATGFWNPFAMTFDPQGRLFAVDNDPDSRPPCRLLHVVEGGDYGFQFRHGRKGTHPFTAWNGELPGTLPMMCGTGEAPSALILDPYVDAVDRKQESWDRSWTLLGTSWGDHRIERFFTAKRGESFSGEMKPVVVGGENFRPVGMDSAADGVIYFTDWVDKSYTLHGKGRVWKLSHKNPKGQRRRTTVYATRIPSKKSDAELRAHMQEQWQENVREAYDPFRWNGSAHALTELLRRSALLDDASAAALLKDFAPDGNATAMIWAAVAARNADAVAARRLVPHLLAHPDPRVRTLGVMWIGNDGLVAHRAGVEKVLSQPGLTRELFECALAALEMLDLKANPNPPKPDNKRQTSGDVFALKVLRDAKAAPTLRRFALKSLPPTHPELTVDLLRQLADDADAAMRVEAIRSLRERAEPEVRAWLRAVAVDERRALDDRVEATIGLRPDQADDRAVLDSLVKVRRRNEVVEEAQRLLRPAVSIDRPMESMPVSLLFDGKAERGERLFFNPRIAACFRCHEHSGRGADIGPDLTTLGRDSAAETSGVGRLLASILYPSHEIGPSYVPWLIETTDGRTLTGLYVGEEIKGEHRYADPAGKIFLLHPNQIEHREAAKQSIMPADLAKSLTDDELRDLIAFLRWP